MNNDSLMKYVKMSLFIILITLTFILVPSFALISSSQSNETLSNDTLSNDTLSDNSENDSPFFENETSFASLSRSLAETNQSEEEEPIPPPPPSESGDEADQEADN
ncbi:MAG: hypothetical protein ACRD97_10255 [Nitrososphaeraceae archaeon]